MPNTSRKHVCTTCARRFVKAEHLHRHQRGHTGAKPFACDQCNQNFTRLDSLTRHQQRTGHNVGFAPSRLVDNQILGPQRPSANAGRASDEMSATSFHAPLPELSDTINADIPGVLNTDAFGDVEESQPDNAESAFPQLTWPESEAFLQSILNVDIPSWPQSFEALPSRYLLQTPNPMAPEVQSPWLASNAVESSTTGTNAVQSISQIISIHSSILACEAESAVLSSKFLESCLHAFFEQMTLVLPVCHRPTFVFRDWTHPLLLNAIALGSLFMGQDIDVAKGEILWTLAHTAVATSWHSLVQHRGPYDIVNGVQLITTALLGQIFAMLSGTSKLRSTAQIFHSLGFYWARQCGMYHNPKTSFLAELANCPSEEQKITVWRRWATDEVKLRALLGHYIIDSQLTYLIGGPTCQRHTSNSLRFPSSDQLFLAENLNEWVGYLRDEEPAKQTFCEFFVRLFDGSASPFFRSRRCSFLALQVILEGLQSLVTEFNSAGCQVVGSPSLEAIERTLYSVHKPIQDMTHLTVGERLQLLLRWHAICIDKAIYFNHLCQSLCSDMDIHQDVFGNARTDLSSIDFQTWTRTKLARKALLHASEIRNILNELPVHAVHAFHIPSTLFSAAIVHIGFVIGGVNNISFPRLTDWSLITLPSNGNLQRDTTLGEYLSNSIASGTDWGPKRNLLYDVNSFLLLTKQIRRPWAICDDISVILHQMCTKSGT